MTTQKNKIKLADCCQENLDRFKANQNKDPRKSARVDSIICPKCKRDWRTANRQVLEIRTPRKIKPPSRPKRKRIKNG